MLIISDKGNYCTDHDYKGKKISICNVHKQQTSILLQVGGQQYRPSSSPVKCIILSMPRPVLVTRAFLNVSIAPAQ